MNKIDKTLVALYIAFIVAASLLCLLFEVIMPDYFGILFDVEDRTYRTLLETICHVISLVGIFGSFKLMAIPSVRKKVKNERVYLKYAILRCALLCVPLLLCELTYYLFCSTNVVAYLGIIGIALLFVWPTEGRRLREMNVENE